MTVHVNIGEAKTHFSKLVDQAMRGEEVIIQRAGVPILRLAPLPGVAKAELDLQWRKLDALLSHIDAIPDRVEGLDPHEWDEDGLPI